MNALALDRARRPRPGPAALKTHGCIPCALGPWGRNGHEALRYTMLAPDGERSFFRCGVCGERWMRTAGMTCRFVWARYDPQKA